jgi:hypothetical protein
MVWYLGAIHADLCGESLARAFPPDRIVERMRYPVVLVRINHEISHPGSIAGYSTSLTWEDSEDGLL